MVLAAAAAAKNPKKKKNSSGNNSNNSSGATTSPQDVYAELERGFDTAYVVSENYEAMDRIAIDPLADNGERTNVVPQFHDDWYFYIWLDILTNEMYLAYKREKEAQFEHISLESEKFKEFAKNHNRLVNKYVRPLEYLVYEGISVYETRKVQRNREQGIEL